MPGSLWEGIGQCHPPLAKSLHSASLDPNTCYLKQFSDLWVLELGRIKTNIYLKETELF